MSRRVIAIIEHFEMLADDLDEVQQIAPPKPPESSGCASNLTAIWRTPVKMRERHQQSTMPYDVVYATGDADTARAACDRLEVAGVRCWLAPREIIGGGGQAKHVLRAIAGNTAVLLNFFGEGEFFQTDVPRSGTRSAISKNNRAVQNRRRATEQGATVPYRFRRATDSGREFSRAAPSG